MNNRKIINEFVYQLKAQLESARITKDILVALDGDPTSPTSGDLHDQLIAIELDMNRMCLSIGRALVISEDTDEDEDESLIVEISVLGGVAEVSKCPENVIVEINDHDDAAQQ